MSANLILAHGGSKSLLGSKGQIVNGGMFVTDTKVGKLKPIHEAHLGSLIQKTTGESYTRPVMDGVLTDTKVGAKTTDVPELHKIHNRGKTQPKRMGQTAYAGKMY